MEESNKIVITVDGEKYFLDHTNWLKKVEWYENKEREMLRISKKYQGVDDDCIQSQGYED